jgi:hypothetical protein
VTKEEALQIHDQAEAGSGIRPDAEMLLAGLADTCRPEQIVLGVSFIYRTGKTPRGCPRAF